MFNLSFRTGNAAFYDQYNGEDYEPQYEVGRILREVAEKVESGWDRGSIADINGNKIGEFNLD